MLLANNFCEETVNAWKLVGTFIYVIKIFVPLLVTAIGAIPFINATTKGNADDLFAAGKSLFFKIIASIIIFLVPTIIPTVVEMLSGQGENSDMHICTSCIQNPNKGDCVAKQAYDPTDVDSDVVPIEGNLQTGDLTSASKKSKKKKSSSSSGGSHTSGDFGDGGGDSPSSSNSNVPSGTKNIIIGDSRTVGMCSTLTGDWNSCSFSNSGGKSSGNDLYIAQGSMSYSWFSGTAVPKVNSIISSNSGTKYNIYSLMGVNMLLYDIDKYISKYNELANGSWKNQKIILVSVTPVNEKIEASHGYSTKNKDIKSFNSKLKSGVKANNVSYCDAYNALGSNFGTPDGLHYDSSTYKKIYNTIMGCK